jgi:hypothetical protein
MKRARDETARTFEDRIRSQQKSGPPEDDYRTLRCNVCLTNKSNVLVKTCGHVSVCNDCIERDFDVRWGTSGKFNCYQCNQPATKDDVMIVQIV